MKKSEKLDIIKLAKESNGLCRMYYKYSPNYRYYFPVEYTEKFFYGAEEDDFIGDGFSIRRICDLKKVEIKDDKCIEFLRKEKVFDSINPPPVQLDSWRTIFESLKKSEKYVIVEHDSLDEDEEDFVIGRIDKINKNSLIMKNFDADGVWDEMILPFSWITSVTFRSRYVSTWEKYLD